MKRIIIALLFAAPLVAQNPTINYKTTAPSGSCTAKALPIQISATNQICTCGAGTWVCTAAGGGGAPSGPAGGVLSGTYPNPGLSASPQAIPNGWTATTQTPGTNNTTVATTAFDAAAIAASLVANPAFKFVTTQTVTGSANATISFTSIPATATNLQIMCHGTQTSGGNQVGITFNSDTTSGHYASGRQFLTLPGTPGGSSPGSTAYGFIAFWRSLSSITTISIPGYADSIAGKSYTSLGIGGTSSGEQGFGEWNQTGAITRIDLTVEAADTFTVGTFCTLYGMP